MAEYKQKLLFRDDQDNEFLGRAIISVWAFSYLLKNSVNPITGRFKISISVDAAIGVDEDGLPQEIFEESYYGEVYKWSDKGWLPCFASRRGKNIFVEDFENELVDKFRCFTTGQTYEEEYVKLPKPPPIPKPSDPKKNKIPKIDIHNKAKDVAKKLTKRNFDFL